MEARVVRPCGEDVGFEGGAVENTDGCRSTVSPPKPLERLRLASLLLTPAEAEPNREKGAAMSGLGASSFICFSTSSREMA